MRCTLDKGRDSFVVIAEEEFSNNIEELKLYSQTPTTFRKYEVEKVMLSFTLYGQQYHSG